MKDITFGASEKRFVNEVRKPLKEEFPNNFENE